jgi:hypothetical protein
MLTYFLAAAAQASGMIANTNSPPPVIVAVSPPPSVPVMVPPNAVAAIRVRVAAGTRTLFDDELRVGRGSGASYNENRSEASSIDCSTDRFYGSGDRHSLTVQLNLRDEQQTGPAVNINVTWSRPASATVCPSEGSRSVSLAQTIPLGPGQSATVRGDGGLSVTLTRR